MTSAWEKFVLNGIDVNDGVNFVAETFAFMPAQKKPQFVSNADMDGDVLVQEAHYGPAYFEISVRLAQQAASTAAALAKIGELIDAVQGCERLADGGEGFWTPNGIETTYTAYVRLGELLEVPIEAQGDLAGWLINQPVVKIKLTCKPFLYTEERVVLAPVESSEPMQQAYIKVGGDVPAEGRLVITDKATQVRRYMDWGQEILDSEAGNPDLELEANTDFTVTGYSGKVIAGAITGSRSAHPIEVALTGAATGICATGPKNYVGIYRLKLRFQTAEAGGAEGVYVRAAYRTGDGSWQYLSWVSVDLNKKWVELDLGEAIFEEVEKGTQVSEIKFEAFAETKAGTAYLDTLTTPPARRYGRARGPATASPSAVCQSLQSIEVRSDAVQREDATGSFWSDVPEYRGAQCFLDPEGATGRVNRIVVRMRRTDITEEAEENLTDKQGLEVVVKERWLMPRG